MPDPNEENTERRRTAYTEDDRKLLLAIAAKIQNEKVRKIFGLAPADFFKGISFLFFAVFYVFRTDMTVKEIVKTNAYLAKFAQNSDSYHSATTGLQFEQGRPIPNTYHLKENQIPAHLGQG